MAMAATASVVAHKVVADNIFPAVAVTTKSILQMIRSLLKKEKDVVAETLLKLDIKERVELIHALLDSIKHRLSSKCIQVAKRHLQDSLNEVEVVLKKITSIVDQKGWIWNSDPGVLLSLLREKSKIMAGRFTRLVTLLAIPRNAMNS